MITESQALALYLENEVHLAGQRGYLPDEGVEELPEPTPEELARIHAEHQAYIDRKIAWCLAAGM